MKQKQCRCGNMVLTYPGHNVLRIRGGFVFGNGRAFARCTECPDRIRIGYDIELEDKKGEVFHKMDGDKGGKKATGSNPRKRNKKQTRKEVWRFVD